MKRRSHADPVTAELAQAVFLRDGRCVAPLIDPECGPCWGRTTLEHVKLRARMGRRAESTLRTLAAVCEGHTEPGMKAGRVWNLSHKAELRTYLEERAAA